MTPLADLLIRRIAQNGPMTLADYMAECLMHPEHGYYTGRDPLGLAGDFTTAPEISQMFGELLGLCLAQSWLDQGAPAPFCLAELGPGRGTLMADLLRATRAVPGFHAAMRLCLVEGSPVLRTAQAGRLAGHDPRWFDRVEDLPDGPLFLIANEFFDALPIRQFTRRGNGWSETVIGLHDGALRRGLTPPAPLATLTARLADTVEGDVVEICPAGAAIAAGLGARIADRGGVALIVDYGAGPSLGDTFQALSGHAPTDPLAEPGRADLTAHVDFRALAEAARPAASAGPMPQGLLLARLGIGPRAARLAENLTDGPLAAHHAATHRLTHDAEMGTLFKALAIHPSECKPPPGFD
ncbi:class I SAM-dependent methyltransferase [Szabonella alba]|uniref:SAM-dependent methyltransferase n=1 Tax=Szabonella alba TaxID=2804194 RepID=A0A8K0V670_9RHOB|nr:SAM-dependent methyltransferase [Szabonella alba]MBL4916118.1 SAM-dependent methyltransferase [Szabonella alba]